MERGRRVCEPGVRIIIMHPILLQIGPVSIYSWGFMVALAFAAGIGLAVVNGRRIGLSADQVLDLAMYVLISSIIGARLFYVVQFWSSFRDNIWSVFAVWEGGMVFYGGLIFAGAAAAAVSHIKKFPVLKVLDIAAPCVAIGYSIGRLGCFLRGCCFGRECSLPWAMHFHDVPGFVHPTQLYSSVSGLLIFIALTRVLGKKKYDGQVVLWGTALYSAYRFIIEFFRFSPDYYLGFTPAQWISAAFFILAGITVLIKAHKRPRK